MTAKCRFPPPWSVDQQAACFVVRDHCEQQLAYVYFEDESGREQHPTLTLAEAMDAISLNGQFNSGALQNARAAVASYVVEPTILVQHNCMEHRGIRYAIRIGIAPGQWCVAIYPPGGGMPKERPIFGTREEAEAAARSMINASLKKRAENAGNP
jgi:hypothetical protein